MLSLLLTTMLAVQAVAVMEVMVPEQPVVALHGRDATLNCSFTPTTAFNLSDLTVFWQLTDTKRSVHGYREGNDQLADQAERFTNRTSLFPTQLGLGNASLLLNRVGVADEGSYTCFVRVQDYGSAALLLQVAASYSKPVVSLEPESNLRPGDKVALTCVAYGGYPQANVIWQDGSGRNLTDNITNSLVANEEGLFTMTSVLTVVLEPNSTYSCRLINPLLGEEGYAFVTITANSFQVHYRHLLTTKNRCDTLVVSRPDSGGCTGSSLTDEDCSQVPIAPSCCEATVLTTNAPCRHMGRQESHGENIGHLVASSGLDSESFPFQTGESSKLSVRDWVRSAQAMLQTPEKLTDKQPKTPEDSAKKTRKFQSGGLAERLNRLQCRQRSAVSFWRHQSLSDASETKVDKPGVLVLEVLEVLEECSMRLVRCEHHQSPQDDQTHSNPKSDERTQVMVLFGRETAVHLNPAPKDIIHIYPPWQSLSIEGFGCDIILNTHFSQKVFSASKPASMCTQGLLPAVRCPPYSLCKTFGLLEECRTTENSAKQVTALESLCCIGGSGDLSSHSVSLLEVIEDLGVAGTVRQDVEVVVQRVYSVTVPDPSTMSVLKPRGPFRSSLSLPPAEKGKTRLCLLVQDSYGMFSVTHLHLLPCKDDLHQFCHMWQGRTCVLRGMKVVQRVTRERHTRLFSLIDSLWPPMVALKDHGSIPSMSSVSRPVGPAPSFCYLLSGQESSVQPDDGQTLSPLYFPPTKQTLCDILQSELKIFRCSFVATVIYKRLMQSSDMGHGEVWLVLTDPSLQEEKPERMCKRTVALCVNTSCVLTSSVLGALNSSSVCCMSFRDAVRENGVLLCVEQSVIEMCPVDPEGSVETPTGSKSLSRSLSEPQAKTLPQPVRLDPLTPEITPNSLCSLTGIIIGVDEDTAYSWPACNHCGSDNLEMLAGRPETYHCVSCKSELDKPDTRIQMEVFLSSSFSNCTLKVKLQRKTIMSVLGSAVLEGDEFPDCDVENVLGKEVGPLAVYVRVVTRKPALWISLEEICM